MKNVFLLSISLLLLITIGCDDEVAKVEIDLATYQYLGFGHLYGFCQGEECIEIFRLDDRGISEDTKDTYPSRTEAYDGNFALIEGIDLAQFESLITMFPEELFNEEEIVLGCPDCADQGGLYIEIAKEDGTKRFWILDTNKDSVPTYTHQYMDLILNAINMIND